MAIHNKLGQQGERIAIDYLCAKGYRILRTNWFYGKAEVDIIAVYLQYIVFIEVKTRSSSGFGLPEEFVSEAKQKMLQQAAEGYIFQNRYEGEIRFDIVSVMLQPGASFSVHHIEDAFWG